MPEDTYWRSWSRDNRGLLILLLDQSGSMQDQIQIDNRVYTNGQMATAILNHLLASAIANTPPDDQRVGIKDYCDILVLGYGDQVVELLSNGTRPISIRDLPARAKGKKKVQIERFDPRKNQFVIATEEQHIWVETVESSRRTEMFLVLERVHQEIAHWLQEDRQRHWSHPPIVINITDGQHNGKGDPLQMAQQIGQLSTSDGHVLLYNCHLTSHGQQRLVFPRQVSQVEAAIRDQVERKWAKMLFQMSSLIPETMIDKARTNFNAVLESGAHGFIYNANPTDLIDFLRWGTQA